MQNQGMSVGTTAQKSSKCSLLLRQPCILAMLMLCAIFSVRSQNVAYGMGSLKENIFGSNSNQLGREQDTVKVLILLSDTTSVKNTNPNVINDRRYDFNVYWRFGYSVREKHNTDEGQIDPYSAYGYVSKDYWVHKFYLDIKKERFASTVIIWQSVSAK